MPNSDGRLGMIVPHHRTWIVPALALLLLALPISAWAGGFPGRVRDTLGLLFDAAPPRRTAPRPHSTHDGAEAMHRLRHWGAVLGMGALLQRALDEAGLSGV